MSFGITFGSIGDLIAISPIAITLARSLSESRGSAKEYQTLAKELRDFDKALLQASSVIAVWQNYDLRPELQDLCALIRDTAKDWRDVLLEFQIKINKKYGTSLCAGGSQNRIKDVANKFRWLTEKEDIVNLRKRLQSGSEIVTMLTNAAMSKSNKLDNITHANRVQKVYRRLDEGLQRVEERMSLLEVLDERMEAESQKTNLILYHVKNNLGVLTCIRAGVLEIKATLLLFQSHISSMQAIMSGLGTHWRQEPVTLEDALGNVLPIPLELVSSWAVFHAILAERFEGLPGKNKIIRREYAIEESRTGRELSTSRAWTMCFRAGQKVNMSMIFTQKVKTASCPGCGMRSQLGYNEIVECDECGIIFRRMEKVIEETEARTQHSFETLSTTPPPNGLEDVAADFKRVRLMQISRPAANKHDVGEDIRLAATRYTKGSLSSEEREIVTIKVDFNATIMVGEAQIKCPAGGEIEIKQVQKTRRRERSISGFNSRD